MKELQLTNGMIAKVDDADLGLLSRYTWSAHGKPSGRTIYARGYFRRKDGGDGTFALMHRLLLPGIELIDHINGDGLDNRRENLRPASATQSAHNTRPRRGSVSRFKGVCRKNGMWQASICAQGNLTYLGLFSDEEDAAIAYNRAAERLQGEFACLNHVTRQEFRIGPHCRDQKFGEAHHRSKLTEDDVIDIRTAYALGARIADLARAYNIGTSQVHRVVNHNSWTHVCGLGGQP